MIGKTNAIIQAGTDEYKDVLGKLIERNITYLKIPDGITKIGANAFNSTTKLETVIVPEGVTEIEYDAFRGCGVSHVELPSSLTHLGIMSFYNCANLKTIILPEGLQNIGSYCWQGAGIEEIRFPSTLTTTGTDLFRYCPLKKVYLPKFIPYLGGGTFNYCKLLEEVILEDGFNSNYLKLSDSTLYTTEMIVSWLEALADRTGQTTYTLTIGATNLAKLTEEQIAIATAKNWTLA